MSDGTGLEVGTGIEAGRRPLEMKGAIIVYRKPPVRPGVPKSFSDESLMVYKNLLG